MTYINTHPEKCSYFYLDFSISTDFRVYFCNEECFYVDLWHLPYQTFINTSFYLMFHNNLFLNEISNMNKIAVFYTKLG